MSNPVVSYDGKRLIPAPFVSITKSYQRSGNDEIIGATYSINVTGTIVAFKGSPNSSKVFHILSGYPADETVLIDSRLGAILRKQEAIRDLFSEDGKSFEVQSADATQPMKCNPRVISINFPEGVWTDICQYTIVLECDKLYPVDEDSFPNLLKDVQESWSLETDENAEGLNLPRTYRVSHNVTAVGKRFYDSTGSLPNQPWELARDYVLTRLGINSQFLLSSGVNNLPSYYGGYNHTRNENRDERAGSYNVTESWILTSGTALEDFSIETTSRADSAIRTVSINGNITGLEQRDANLGLLVSKYNNALAKFSSISGILFSRAQNYSNLSLNIAPLSARVGVNPIGGTLNYGYDYDTRPSNLVSGAISEVISLQDSLSTNVTAIIPVLGRALGPVLQPIGTSDALTRQLSIEVVMPTPSFGTGSVADIRTAFLHSQPSGQVDVIIQALSPANNGYSQCYVQSNQASWDAKNGRYSHNITWVYEI